MLTLYCIFDIWKEYETQMFLPKKKKKSKYVRWWMCWLIWRGTSFHNVYVCQITTMYTLITLQFYLQNIPQWNRNPTKKHKKKKRKKKKRRKNEKSTWLWEKRDLTHALQSMQPPTERTLTNDGWNPSKPVSKS